MTVFLSTPSARRATGPSGRRGLAVTISIHALREEGDAVHRERAVRRNDFYPRPPRGGRLATGQTLDLDDEFLSTPSARRATVLECVGVLVHVISIHALREEGDRCRGLRPPRCSYFYPRPPRGGRRGLCTAARTMEGFLSTPSARRATPPPRRTGSTRYYFYPRPPRGGRLNAGEFFFSVNEFLSTPSARRATPPPRRPC